jgi:hypothetical protein
MKRKKKRLSYRGKETENERKKGYHIEGKETRNERCGTHSPV